MAVGVTNTNRLRASGAALVKSDSQVPAGMSVSKTAVWVGDKLI